MLYMHQSQKTLDLYYKCNFIIILVKVKLSPQEEFVYTHQTH